MQTEGIRGFYRGLGASLITYMPASAIWWFTYEQTKPLTYPYRLGLGDTFTGKDSNRNYMGEVLAGSFAGVITTVLTNPLEIVKTRLQTQMQEEILLKQQSSSNSITGSTTSTSRSIPSSSTPPATKVLHIKNSAASAAFGVMVSNPQQTHHEFYRNTFHGLKDLIAKEGWSSIGKGLIPRLLIRIPLHGMSALLYEVIINTSKKNPEE